MAALRKVSCSQAQWPGTCWTLETGALTGRENEIGNGAHPLPLLLLHLHHPDEHASGKQFGYLSSHLPCAALISAD